MTRPALTFARRLLDFATALKRLCRGVPDLRLVGHQTIP
jgi:hypothetical protein